MLKQTKFQFNKLAISTKNIDSIAAYISSYKTVVEIEEKLAEFHQAADSLPWLQDHDYGALLLEEIADNTPNIKIRKYLLNVAASRAYYCASCGTSGGEQLARSQHWKTLKSKLEHCT